MPEASKPVEKSSESNLKETSGKPDIEDFEWLQYQDTGDQPGRLAVQLLQNPLVPIGACATVIALACGLYNMRKNNSAKQQFYMRARVGAQGFTIASLLGGIFYQSHKREVENQEKLDEQNKPNKDAVANSNDKQKL